MSRWLMCWLSIGLAGCATTSTLPPAPPMPDDIRWSQAEVVEEPIETRSLLPSVRPRQSGEKVVPFVLGTEVHADVMVGKPLRIELQSGEKIHNVVDGYRGALSPGDVVPPWDVTESTSGGEQQPHVLVTATKPGLVNGLTITTSKRVYDVALRSVSRSNVRVVRWEYADEVISVKAPRRILPDARVAQQYHVGYKVEPSTPQPVWTPLRPVVDNNKQTFITLPANLAVMPAPMIRLLGPDGPELVNALLYKNIVIVPHLFNAAELRYGAGEHAETVRIIRQEPRLIDCPGDLACPVWPVSSQAVAGR